MALAPAVECKAVQCSYIRHRQSLSSGSDAMCDCDDLNDFDG